MQIRILATLMILAMGCSGLRQTPEQFVQEPDPVQEPVERTGFRATGNEPFWGLGIEFHNVLKFTSLTEEYPELTFHMPDPERLEDRSLVKYSAKTYNAEMEVAISREECLDTMKGNLFPYTVTLSIRPGHAGEYTVFSGCGRYIGNYRLNDIWTLQKINGDPVEMPGNKRFPTLEIDIANKTMSGFGGCNRYHGRAELTGKSLLTGNIVSTRMACIDTQEIENRFLGTLSGKTMEFSLGDGTLILSNGETELLFRRAD